MKDPLNWIIGICILCLVGLCSYLVVQGYYHNICAYHCHYTLGYTESKREDSWGITHPDTCTCRKVEETVVEYPK